MMRRHLVVFARAPRLGAVKRRLAAGIGGLAALRFHRFTTLELLRRVAGGPWRGWLAVTPDDAKLGRVWPMPMARLPQGRGDLGQRMQRAFDRLPPGPAVLVGSDIPGLGAHHIAAAFKALATHEAVFGPASDGGYWLVGFSRRRRLAPFGHVRWSTAHALADTLANLKHVKVALLDVLDDVDDAAALRRLRSGGGG